MKLTTQRLYKLITEAVVKDPDPAYAALYNPNQPMALLHMDDKEQQTFILYHLTKSKQHPLFVIAYLNMEMIEEKPCIPYTYQVLGVYTEAAAQRRGFSRTLYDFAFYVADRFNYGLTSDHIVGTTKKAEMAAWAKYETSSKYKKRETSQGNQQFDYDGKLTPNDPDDDCTDTLGEKFPATNFSFQKENHGDIGQLFFSLKHNHEQFVKVNKISENSVGSHLYRLASKRFDYYYNKEITDVD